jgi:hypothetical protein
VGVPGADPGGGEEDGVRSARTGAANRAGAPERTERRAQAIGRSAERVAQHERKGLEAARVAMHLAEQVLGLEHPPRRAADREIHVGLGGIESRRGERLFRGDRGHRIGARPRGPVGRGGDVGDGQIRHLGRLVGPLIGGVEKGHAAERARPGHQPVHRTLGADGEGRNDSDAGDENAHGTRPLFGRGKGARAPAPNGRLPSNAR